MYSPLHVGSPTNYESNLFFELFLHRLSGVGPATHLKILDSFGDAKSALTAPLSHIKSFLNDEAFSQVAALQKLKEKSPLGQKILFDIDWITKQPDVAIISFQSPEYPALLREIPKQPPLLFARGDLACLNLPQIGIVGSRNPSSGGIENARRFAEYLAQNGFAITSGLALGIDAAAHQGALASNGRTIAVMGTGIDIIYPQKNNLLAEKILAQGGLLLSEFPLGAAAQAANFPLRNRIISGLSCGVLVVEAAPKSGSLITAQTAVSQNREVFAIPGSIHNPLAWGCHQLIREGATLVETTHDIVEQLSGLLSFHVQATHPSKNKTKVVHPAPTQQNLVLLSPEEQQLLDALGFDPIDVDTLAERTGLSLNQLASQLFNLEMKGVIQQNHAALYLRV